MCDLGLALTGLSTGLSLMGQRQQTQSQVDQLNYQAQQAAADAAAEQGAAQVRADKIRKQSSARQAQARAALAASGVDVDYGSSAEINKQIISNDESDALNEILDGNNRSNRLNQQSNAYKQGARNAKAAGRINTLGTLLSGGANMYAGWKTNQRARPTTQEPYDGNRYWLNER